MNFIAIAPWMIPHRPLANGLSLRISSLGAAVFVILAALFLWVPIDTFYLCSLWRTMEAGIV